MFKSWKAELIRMQPARSWSLWPEKCTKGIRYGRASEVPPTAPSTLVWPQASGSWMLRSDWLFAPLVPDGKTNIWTQSTFWSKVESLYLKRKKRPICVEKVISASWLRHAHWYTDSIKLFLLDNIISLIKLSISDMSLFIGYTWGKWESVFISLLLNCLKMFTFTSFKLIGVNAKVLSIWIEHCWGVRWPYWPHPPYGASHSPNYALDKVTMYVLIMQLGRGGGNHRITSNSYSCLIKHRPFFKTGVHCVCFF